MAVKAAKDEHRRGASYGPTKAIAQEIHQARGQGKVLDGVTASKMALLLNKAVPVTVHDDDTADRLARSVHATAFAAGADIFFRRGRYKPTTADGVALLAHEMTHAGRASQRVPTDLAEARGGGTTIWRQKEIGEEAAPATKRYAPYSHVTFYQDVYRKLNGTVRAHLTAIDQVEATIKEAAKTKIDVMTVVLKSPLAFVVSEVTAGRVVAKIGLDIAKDIYGEGNGMQNQTWAMFAGVARRNAHRTIERLEKRLLEMRERFGETEAAYEGDAERMRAFQEAMKAAARAIPAPPHVADIEKMLFEAWIQGKKGNFFSGSGRILIKYRFNRLLSVTIENVEGAGNIEKEFEQIAAERGQLIDVAEIKVRKFVRIGDIVVRLGPDNDFEGGYFPVKWYEDGEARAKTFWQSRWRQRLPRIRQFGGQ